MNDSRLTRLVEVAAEDLARAESVMLDRLGAIREAMNGWPRSVSCDGDRTSGGSGADPTANGALRSDRAAADRRALEDIARNLSSQARLLVIVLAAYSPRAATPSERAETLRDNERPDCCVSCARVKTALGHPRSEPGWRRVEHGGRMVWLCRWCHDWLRGAGTLPTKDQLRDHHDGKRVLRRVP